jgi:hypothetical protein
MIRVFGIAGAGQEFLAVQPGDVAGVDVDLQVLAEQPDPDRIAVRSGYLLRQQGRKPVPAEQVTDQRAATGLGQGAVFGGAEGGY